MARTMQNETRNITLAELCQALENGSLPAQLEDGMYVISNRDLRRLVNPVVVQMPVSRKIAAAALQIAS